MSLLNNLRDKAIEKIIRKNEWVQRFGDIQNLTINSDKGYVDVDVLLHGEKEPIAFRAYYILQDMGDHTDFLVSSISCGRIWMDELLSLWLEKTTLQYTLPGVAAGLAKIFF